MKHSVDHTYAAAWSAAPDSQPMSSPNDYTDGKARPVLVWRNEQFEWYGAHYEREEVRVVREDVVPLMCRNAAIAWLAKNCGSGWVSVKQHIAEDVQPAGSWSVRVQTRGGVDIVEINRPDIDDALACAVVLMVEGRKKG